MTFFSVEDKKLQKYLIKTLSNNNWGSYGTSLIFSSKYIFVYNRFAKLNYCLSEEGPDS